MLGCPSCARLLLLLLLLLLCLPRLPGCIVWVSAGLGGGSGVWVGYGRGGACCCKSC